MVAYVELTEAAVAYEERVEVSAYDEREARVAYDKSEEIRA
jgi:hypothetical protein